MTTPAEIIDFWFGELTVEQHFKRDDAVDRRIAERFGDMHTELSREVLDAWRGDGRAILAAIIVLDQFSRNLYRDDARAYAQDAAALTLTSEAIARGWDCNLSSDEKQFLYMPLMHSEHLSDVERCVELMRAAGHDDGEAFARRHAAVIARFGRYPSRNAALGRRSTVEEAAFLRDNPMGF